MLRHLLLTAALLGPTACGDRAIGNGSGTEEGPAETTVVSDTGEGTSGTDEPRLDLEGMPPDATCPPPLPGTEVVGQTESGPFNARVAYVATSGCGWPTFRLVFFDDAADVDAEIDYAGVHGGGIDVGPALTVDVYTASAEQVPFSEILSGTLTYPAVVQDIEVVLTVNEATGHPWNDPPAVLSGMIEAGPSVPEKFAGPFVATYCGALSAMAICE